MDFVQEKYQAEQVLASMTSDAHVIFCVLPKRILKSTMIGMICF